MKKKHSAAPVEPDIFRSERLSRNVLAVHFDDVRTDWEKWVLLTSDRHHDSALCKRGLELEHLNEAKRRGALVLDFGDLFDGMQSVEDKRQNKDELRDEDKGRNYLDRLVENATGFYAPFVKHIAMLGRGNHETAILQRYGHDLTSALVSALNQRGGNVQAGWFGGWVFFRFHIQKTVDTTIKLKYFHGAGSGGPVTRGVIQTNRQQVYLPDADIVCNGHCFDDKTEILTPDGWKRNDGLVIGSEVMTLNRESGILEFQRISSISKYTDYKKLISIKAKKGIDIAVTDEHGLWLGTRRGYYKNRRIEWDTEKAIDAFGKDRYIRVSGEEHNDDIDISDSKLRLIAWILTEGNIEENSRTKKDGIPGVIRIAQSDAPDGRLAWLESDLIDSGVKFTKSKRPDDCKIHRNFTAYRYSIKDVKQEWAWIGEFITPEKNVLPRLHRLSLRQRKIIIDTWILGDGSIDKTAGSTGFQLATNNKNHLDFLQSILVRSGYRSTASMNVASGMYYLHACEKQTTYITRDKWSEIDYDGTVWCVTVPNHTLLVRRNNKCAITMNTHDQWHVIIARERVSQHGAVSSDLTHHIRIAGYKDGYSDGASGWEVERGLPPKPTGAVWLRFWYKSVYAERSKIKFDVISAVE